MTTRVYGKDMQDDARWVWRGAWSAGSYKLGDVVTNGGSTYRAIANTATTPPSADWVTIGGSSSSGSGDLFNWMFTR